ncbi:MAG: hypothetical protein WC054_11380 [Candidatus Nanopelagicales bacterium]
MEPSAQNRRVVATMYGSTTVTVPVAVVWDQIINVDIHSFTHPRYFSWLGIPNPLRAEVISSGVGGQRIAYFDNGKRFIQRITVWRPPLEYAFSFNPEKGFKVAFFFDLSDGVVQIPTGSYLLTESADAPGGTTIRLGTQYSIDHRFERVLRIPVKLALRGFQRFLLTAIAKNSLDAVNSPAVTSRGV